MLMPWPAASVLITSTQNDDRPMDIFANDREATYTISQVFLAPAPKRRRAGRKRQSPSWALRDLEDLFLTSAPEPLTFVRLHRKALVRNAYCALQIEFTSNAICTRFPRSTLGSHLLHGKSSAIWQSTVSHRYKFKYFDPCQMS